MAFVEEQQKGGKKYYYLTHTVRVGNSFKKVRVLLSDKTLSKEELKKIATNVLNDGDKVEVNANHGVIKILERK